MARGFQGFSLFCFLNLQSHSPLEGFTLHQRRKTDKENIDLSSFSQWTTKQLQLKHHKHGGFTLAFFLFCFFVKGKVTTSQSEKSPFNSETLKQQHIAYTQHYSVHGPIKHRY